VFAKEGATVVVANRSSDEGEAVVEEIKGAGGAAVFVQTDVRDPASVDGLVKATLDAYGRLDILCHNAGIYPDMLIEDMPVEVWNDTLNTNLTSAFLLTKACVAPMKERRFGRIIITSSITGPSVAMATLVAYGASKGGVNAFVKGAALEFACYGITVNCVCPPPTSPTPWSISPPIRRSSSRARRSPSMAGRSCPKTPTPSPS
jgi:3-oxoacyl-[acyl-carrier protein] reductase